MIAIRGLGALAGILAVVLAAQGSGRALLLYGVASPILSGLAVLTGIVVLTSAFRPRWSTGSLIAPLAGFWWVLNPGRSLLSAVAVAACLLVSHVAAAVADSAPASVHVTPAAGRRIGAEIAAYVVAVALAVGGTLLAVAEAGVIIPRGWPLIVAAVVLLLAGAVAAERWS